MSRRSSLECHLVSVDDLLQFAAMVGLSNRPKVTRLQFLVGRPNATAPARDCTIPGPADSVSSILSPSSDASFTSDEVGHLLAPYTEARSEAILPDQAAAPFGSTLLIWTLDFSKGPR
ncbi:GP1_10 [Sanghuangporus vaninii]